MSHHLRTPEQPAAHGAPRRPATDDGTSPGHPRHLGYAFNGLLLGVNDRRAGTGAVPLNPLEERVCGEVYTLLSRGLGPDDIPRLPESVPLLLERLSAYRNAGEITDLINRDPALAGEVVHLANSPRFRRSPQPVRTVESAFAYMGEEGLREVLVASSLRPAFQIKPIYFRLFGHLLWQHALDCAHACRRFASGTGIDPATAFFTGLIHDMGKLVVFRVTLSAFRSVLPDTPLRPAVFQSLITRFAHELTRAVCAGWQIPDEVKKAIAQQAGGLSEERSALARVLFAAEAVAEAHMLLHERAASREVIADHLRSRGIPWSNFIEVFPEDESDGNPKSVRPDDA